MTRRLTPLAAALAAVFGTSVLLHAQAFAQTSLDTSVSQATQLPTVTVTATGDSPQHLNAKTDAGALGSRSQLDTPFSSTVVKSEDLAERQVNKLGDVFALDASVSDNSGGYTSWATYITVRGLPLDWQNSYRIDGMPFMSYSITPPYEHFEQVELLKGLSGFMYGFAAPGGMVNYVTKKPTDTPVRSVDVGYLSNNVWREHIDLGGRVGQDGRFGYRLNATHEDGETFNKGSIKRDSLSLALDAKLTRDLTWTFDALYQKRKLKDQTQSISAGRAAMTGYTSGYTGSGLPSVVRDDDQTLVGGGQFLDTDLQMYTTGLKYQLAPNWALSAAISHSESKRRRNEGTAYLLNSAGDYNDVRSDSNETGTFDYASLMVEGEAMTGSIKHQLVFGASSQKQKNDYSANSQYVLIGTGNLNTQNPNNYESVTDFDMVRDSEITQKAIFASDTVQLSDRWSVIGGLRYTDYKQTSRFAVDAPYKENVVSPTAAVMYKLEPGTTLYASYVESLEQGARAGVGLANDGTLLDPLESKQYEFGIKTEREKWSATAALFRIERGAEYTNAANELVQDGETIYQGLELAASARLGSQWDVLGSLMFLDSEYKKGAVNIGNRVAGAPEFIAAAQLGYRVAQLPGLRLLADAKYTGNTMLNGANDLKVPGYTLLNVGASYTTRIGGKDTTFRAAINNVADKKYWEYQYENWIKPADPRTLSVSVKVDF
ncbi:MAG TPA: TonB-dependent receptor [Oxalicibacterium sp.]|uniref:TonB-dependent siderophore receptor n=1 Tax=Oxalicibacterium sp. TaxID=2766525 RepID=UPI002C5FF508|nr:TonB-dependent receptor [Oxalicibacterium sp.]HWU97456.1 TonB-dependent receptor [Oxalicibacterium sp.]